VGSGTEIFFLKDIVEIIHVFYRGLKNVSKRPFLTKWFVKGIELEEILNRLDDADKRLLMQMPTVQEPTDVEYDRIAKNYIEEIYGKRKNFIRFMNWVFFKKYFLKRIKVNQGLNVDVSPDLKNVEFTYNNEHRIVTTNQKLLWPCNCGVPPEYKNTEIQCPIHSHKSGDAITNAFRFGIVKINFMNTEVYYKDTDAIWPPAIDSLFFALLLEKYFGNMKNLRRILDMGAGTGFLGIFLGEINENVKEITFIDVFLEPFFLSTFNCYRNLKGYKIKYRSIPSNGFDLLDEDGKYDLVLCNPPYLPLLGIREIAGINAVSGTYLLDRVLNDSGKYSNQLVIGASDIVKPEINEYFQKARKTYKKIEINEIGHIEAPFRVSHAFKASGYMDRLFNSRRKYFKIKQDAPIKLWHTVRYYHVIYR